MPPLGLESYTIHSVVCCCTNYIILAPSHFVTNLIKLKKYEFGLAFIGIMFILICIEICPAISLEAYRWIDLQTD